MAFRILFFLALVLHPRDSSAGREPVGGGGYRARYPLQTAAQKLVDDQGKGFTNLYGTRNFRAVLNGVYYRGGANNVYFVPKRPNQNPLPNRGLQSLCEEGFSRAVYLYEENYGTAPPKLSCRDRNGHDHTIEYLQISPLSYDQADLKALLTLIHRHVQDPRLGPIYDHCWNGWHASGYVAATTLRQFCGFTAEQAVAYWNLNTDGNNVGPGYDKIRARIRAFTPFAELSLSEAEKNVLCPAPGTLRFPARKRSR